jgi:hypothetical protein
MLAHSPPLPLIVDYIYPFRCDVGAENEVEAMMQELVAAIDNEFPILECLGLWSPPFPEVDFVMLPEMFRAPRLRHLQLSHFAFPIRSQLLTTSTMGIAVLWLKDIHPSVYFPPDHLIQQLSLMPHLETLGISFRAPIPKPDDDGGRSLQPIMTHVTLPKLRWLMFEGFNGYLEALLPWITTPLLEKLYIRFIERSTFSVPHLLQFMSTMETLRFKDVRFSISFNSFSMKVYPHEASRSCIFKIFVACDIFYGQIPPMVQVFCTLSPVFSAVERLTLDHERFESLSWDLLDRMDRILWRTLLGSFSKVKTIHVEKNLVHELSRSLQLDDGESPIALLPELTKLSYSASNIGDAFTSFISARQDAGHPVTLVRH